MSDCVKIMKDYEETMKFSEHKYHNMELFQLPIMTLIHSKIKIREARAPQAKLNRKLDDFIIEFYLIFFSID